MCTAISVKSNGHYFGRTMDICHSFGGQVVTVPRKYPLPETFGCPLTEHYAITGMAAVVDGYPLFADGFNEAGLCMAALSFPKSAVYTQDQGEGRTALASFELIPHILGLCESVREARALLRSITVSDVSFRADIPSTPLHWLIADGSEALAVESVAEGLMLYEAESGILTNEPPYPFHKANAELYSRLSRRDGEGFPVTHGLGALGLPGDWSSPSRFIRGDFLLRSCRLSEECGEEERVAHAFELLSAIAPPRGAVMTYEGKAHHTHYTCCMNPQSGIYYLRKHGKLSVEAHAVCDSQKQGCRIIY